MRGLLVLFGLTVFFAVGATAEAGAVDADLMAAIRAADADEVRAALTRGADVSAADPDGTTPLHWAVHVDDATIVELLLSVMIHQQRRQRPEAAFVVVSCFTTGSALSTSAPAARRNRVTSIRPSRAAKSSGLHPCAERSVTSAPCVSIGAMTSACPSAAAHMSAVCPRQVSAALTSAP